MIALDECLYPFTIFSCGRLQPIGFTVASLNMRVEAASEHINLLLGLRAILINVPQLGADKALKTRGQAYPYSLMLAAPQARHTAILSELSLDVQ